MNDTVDGLAPDEQAAFSEWQQKVAGANISQSTLLATDYLNHFNEIVMLLELVADMPDMLEECKAWAPKSYQDHFRDSTFRDKDLAVEAYNHVPSRFRRPFEDTVEQMNGLVFQALERLEDAVTHEDPDMVKIRAQAASRGIQRLIDVASSIIHGSDRAMDQAQIDEILRL